MRRKGTRGGSTSSPEKAATPRRSSRRGRKSPEVDTDNTNDESVVKSGSSSENESDYGTDTKRRKKINRNMKAKTADEKSTSTRRGRGRTVKIIAEERVSDIEETDENGETSQVVETVSDLPTPEEEDINNTERLDDSNKIEIEDTIDNTTKTPPNEFEGSEIANQLEVKPEADEPTVVVAETVVETAVSAKKIDDDESMPKKSPPRGDHYVRLDSDVEMEEAVVQEKKPSLEETDSTVSGEEKVQVPDEPQNEIKDQIDTTVSEKVEAVRPEKIDGEIENNSDIVKCVEIASPKASISSRKPHSCSRSRSPEPKNNNSGETRRSTTKHSENEEKSVPISKDKEKSKLPDESRENSETTESKKSQPIIQRKRRWLSKKASESKPSVITISTDSLKDIISDVQPVPLCDVKLESSPEPEEIRAKEKEENRQIQKQLAKEKLRKKLNEESERYNENRANVERTQIIKKNNSVTGENYDEEGDDDDDDEEEVVTADNKKTQNLQTVPKSHVSNILFITNLVRPFTVLQLKGLLARTGKIVENGFWIDKIKSKCYVKYETEDESSETRHALNGVRWPTSNPKCLNVDFAFEKDMENAIISTMSDNTPRLLPETGQKSERDFGWSKENLRNDSGEKVIANRPVREWDVGKKDDLHNEKVRDDKTSRPRPNERERDREFGWDRKRSSKSPSPARKFKKKENDPPLRLLDDLFRKTKITPCIYWLPLTAEQISVKEEMRRKHMAEHQRRMDEIKKQERERSRERGGGSNRRSDSRDRRRNSRDRRRYR